MKTNQIIIRKLGNFLIRQILNEDLFCISDLSNAINLDKSIFTAFMNNCTEYQKYGVDSFFVPSSILIDFVDSYYVTLGFDVRMLSSDILYSGCDFYTGDVVLSSSKRENKRVISYDSFYSALEYIGIKNVLKCMLLAAEEQCCVSKKKTVFQNTYLIYDDQNGLYKIGKSNNVQNRVRALSISNQNLKLKLIHLGDIELYLHKKFAKKRVFGEWFKLTDEDICDLSTKYNFEAPESFGK